jgi:8-oxo-dGTP diphosphatase
MTIVSTVCWIIKDDKVLLKLANSGISKGKWNAPGGKNFDNESGVDCIKREVFEETGLKIEHPTYHGFLNFFLGKENKGEPDWITHIFSTRGFSGELKESREGSLKWFELNELPFKNMWQDDLYWVPLLLEGKKFLGNFYFSKDGKELLDFNLEDKGCL